MLYGPCAGLRSGTLYIGLQGLGVEVSGLRMIQVQGFASALKLLIN